mmetsp:Transcript_27804/g.44086  ORF Transcript_27804/g.44086 Transcript_27804/m.44086 type:complete len:191 (+) Transcript_27804:149-721(+)|eukprot:CAMPEP_0197047754 /NCGR_PEP_ID=MMETSP1384-20130603/23214_1 /TAXON_ID=29189 /ORGANISM="Ammonia sp." /LENGTH=190 /DNA_ID=CAMNT_0042479751 /DNA_START=161 /DNA_END=733 /DNA_ORIENTATION=+
MESLAFATASSFISGINHSMAYQVAGKLLLVMEGIVTMEVSHPDVKKVLIELDIKASVSTIKALMEDLRPILPKCGSTLKVCVENLNASMTQIQAQLDVVEKKCAAHKKSWSAYIYSNPDVTNQLNEIRKWKKIMDHRIELLTKSATIELQLMSINKLPMQQVALHQAPDALSNDHNDAPQAEENECKQD